jgi:hypothetical protein
MRRPRNPVPPNTVTRREDMTRKYRAALGYAIIFSALPEAKQASAQARRIRRVTSSDEFQACARPPFASGTEGSNPAPSSAESANARSLANESEPRGRQTVRGTLREPERYCEVNAALVQLESDDDPAGRASTYCTSSVIRLGKNHGPSVYGRMAVSRSKC